MWCKMTARSSVCTPSRGMVQDLGVALADWSRAFQRVVATRGGQVTVASQAGQGSSFPISVPYAFA